MRTLVFVMIELLALASGIAASGSAHAGPGSGGMGQLKTLLITTPMTRLAGNSTWSQKITLPDGLISYVLRVKALADVQDEMRISVTDGTGQVSNYASILVLPRMKKGDSSLSPVLRLESGVRITAQIDRSALGPKPPIQLSLLLLDRLESIPATSVPDGELLVTDAARVGLGQSIARLIFPAGTCTGFALTENYLLTNSHCVANPRRICDELAIEFNAVSKGEPGNGARCLRLVSSDALLDYALIEFRPAAPVPALPIYAGPVAAERVEYFSIHHAWGQEAIISTSTHVLARADPSVPSLQRVSDARRQCGLAQRSFATVPLNQFDATLTHRIDTDPGSSGAPIMHAGKVVALHFDMDRRLYLTGWIRPNSINFDCLKARAGYANWATEICAIVRQASGTLPNDIALSRLATRCTQ